MLTISVMAALLASDIAGAFILAGGPEGRLLASLPMLLAWHVLASACLMNILVWRFPVPHGVFGVWSPETDAWRARACLAAVSCNYFDRWIPIALRHCWYVLYGARLAWNTRVAGRILDCSLVEMGSRSRLNAGGLILAHMREGQWIRLGHVAVGQRAVVGVRAVLLPGAVVGNDAVVEDGGLVMEGINDSTSTGFSSAESSDRLGNETGIHRQ